MRILSLLVSLLVGAPVHAADRALEAVQDGLAALAAEARPAVVRLEVIKREPFTAPLEEFLLEAGVGDRRTGQPVGKATGSGVIVSADGRVYTNHHVVAGAVEVQVILADERRVEARVLGSDPRTDVAVLQLESREGEGKWPFLPLGDSDRVRVGDLVLAVGSPFDFASTFTWGIVSATGRRGVSSREIQDYIQTDAAVNPGNSGGPLLDVHGRVVGLNTAIYSPVNEQNSGISFAIPAKLLSRVGEDLIADGRVRRAWVGLDVRTTTEVPGEAGRHGAEVVRVRAGSPAEIAGLRRGDIVLTVNGEPMPTATALADAVAALAVGEQSRWEVARDQRRVSVEVGQGDRGRFEPGPAVYPEVVLAWGGLVMADATPALIAHFGRGPAVGPLVLRVEPGSVADRFGFAPGDAIVAVGAIACADVEALRAARASAAGPALLRVERGGQRLWAVLPNEGE